MKLTQREVLVLDYMVQFFGENDQLPPLEAIRVHLGMTSVSSPHHYVRTLEEYGYIERNAVGKFRFTRETEATV